MEKEIEKPMRMNYRESYAWQLGWEKGVLAQKHEEIEFLENINSFNRSVFDIKNLISIRLKGLKDEVEKH